MSNMWSQNKYIESLINTLIFLVAVNFLHYGQLILPIICLILFIDNKFKFKVNNIKIFVVLCLFAISFCYFSYDMGFYCTMGFCIPMAYYIGSNIKNANEDNIKKVIYILTFGMAMHFILNFVYDFYYYETNLGVTPFGRHSHYDIWLLDEVATTGTSVNFIFIIGCFSYLLFYEKNKKYRYIGITLFIISFIYDLVIGRRTPILILLINIFIYLLLSNKKTIFKKENIKIFSYFVIVILVFLLFYLFNVFGFKNMFNRLLIVEKFTNEGLHTERLDIIIAAVKQMPYHLWGGFEIMNTIGDQIHMLWLDIYDYAGIVPFVLFMIYTVYITLIIRKVFIKNKMNKALCLLLCSLLVSTTIQMMLEPVMTGSSIFLICTIVLLTVLEVSVNDVYQS